MPLWTLAEAVPLIQEIEKVVRPLDYHTCLGGSVLHKGESDDDLDIFFIPLNGSDSEAHKILQVLGDEVFGWKGAGALRDGPDYHSGSSCHFKEMYKFTYLNKRIDVFIQ